MLADHCPFLAAPSSPPQHLLACSQITHSSDYFKELHAFAVRLIHEGLAYVCHQSGDEIKASREAKAPSPFRDRPAAESLRLFDDMRRCVQCRSSVGFVLELPMPPYAPHAILSPQPFPPLLDHQPLIPQGPGGRGRRHAAPEDGPWQRQLQHVRPSAALHNPHHALDHLLTALTPGTT